MAEPKHPILQRIIEGCSSLLLLVGATVFLVGDKFLHEVKHAGFLASEGVGIAGGIVLMLLGGGLALAVKSPKRERH